ncbi:MAG TPA: DUF6370 family protein [Flavobacterium sp.]|jgi:hypothetical protein|nr:DUF6370 family protein [Flavobacterium sp.]
MKNTLAILLFLFAYNVNAQDKKPQVVEASCGQCNFGMKSRSGCDLAVRIDGKSYFVDGEKLDTHGDAHAHDGFCSVVRKAEVTGEIVGERYKATSFKLLPVEPVKK